MLEFLVLFTTAMPFGCHFFSQYGNSKWQQTPLFRKWWWHEMNSIFISTYGLKMIHSLLQFLFCALTPLPATFYAARIQPKHKVTVTLIDKFWNKWKCEGQKCKWRVRYRKAWINHSCRMDKDRQLKTTWNWNLYGKNGRCCTEDLVAGRGLVCAEKNNCRTWQIFLHTLNSDISHTTWYRKLQPQNHNNVTIRNTKEWKVHYLTMTILHLLTHIL